MGRVHVGLNLENETGKRRFRRFDFSLDRFPSQRWARPVEQGVQYFTDTEIIDGRAEEYRSQCPGKEFFQHKRIGCPLDQLDFHLQLFHFHRKHFHQAWIVDTLDSLLYDINE